MSLVINSLVSEFTDATNEWLSKSQKNSKDSISKVTVEVKTVDSICEQYLVNPNFLKIDVEGAELSVLKGAKQVLQNARALMVEVSRNHKEVFNILKTCDFVALDAKGVSLGEELTGGNKNISFVKEN